MIVIIKGNSKLHVICYVILACGFVLRVIILLVTTRVKINTEIQLLFIDLIYF